MYWYVLVGYIWYIPHDITSMLTLYDRVTLVAPQMIIYDTLACMIVTFKVRQCGDDVYNMTVRDQSDSVIWSDTPGKLIHLI